MSSAVTNLLSPSSLSISIYHFPQSKSNNLFTLLSPVKPQLAVLRISTRPQFKSSVHKIACTKTPQSLLLSIAKGSALFLVGSFLFLAQFNLKLALATVTPQSSSISSPLEEKSKTQNEKKGKKEKNEKKVEKDDELVEMYERYLEKSPMDIEALKIVLYGKLRKLKMEAALQYIERLEVLEPKNVEWRLLEAVAYEKMGKLSKAEEVYRKILDEQPHYTRALHGLALVMEANQTGTATLKMLNEALELACRENRVTDERNIKILIAMMHISKGDFDGALKRFDDMTDEDPNDFRPYLCKGILYNLLNDQKEADQQLDIYKSLVPDEFPQRGFLDDCIHAAKNSSLNHPGEKLLSEISYKK